LPFGLPNLQEDNSVMQNQNILIYQNTSGNIKVDVRFEEESIWLSQAQICELYGKAKSTISEHIKAIFEEGELNRNATVRNFRTVQTEGSREVAREIEHYNLDMIIAIGFRVRSSTGTKFRIWANEKLKEYMTKGFVLDDERFKSGKEMNYFDELQNRLREIRLSERFLYQKIKDIYMTSIDYNPKDAKTIKFFKIVQNKLLGLLVEQYLAFAQTMATQQTPMKMSDWIARLDIILSLNGRELLTHAGKISHDIAKAKSEAEYQKYKEQQKGIEKLQSFQELEEDIKRLQ